jgi:hypothetical protein
VANSSYNSLQVSVTERTGKGLTFMFDSIWSKAIDDGETYRWLCDSGGLLERRQNLGGTQLSLRFEF